MSEKWDLLPSRSDILIKKLLRALYNLPFNVELGWYKSISTELPTNVGRELWKASWEEGDTRGPKTKLATPSSSRYLSMSGYTLSTARSLVSICSRCEMFRCSEYHAGS